MSALMVCGVLTFLSVLGSFVPAPESRLALDTGVENGMPYAITVRHLFGY